MSIRTSGFYFLFISFLASVLTSFCSSRSFNNEQKQISAFGEICQNKNIYSDFGPYVSFAFQVSCYYGTNDITPPVPAAFPSGGKYPSAVSVQLRANETANIYFTLDGTSPTTASTQYTTAISIPQNMTLKYIAVDAAGNTSATFSSVYEVNAGIPQVLITDLRTRFPAVFSFTVNDQTDVTINWTASVAGQYRVLTGLGTIAGATERLSGSHTAGAQVSVINGGVLAGGVNNLFVEITDSLGAKSYSSAVLLRDDTYPVVRVDVAGALYNTPQTITLTANENAQIYYTTDGSTPTSASALYTAPLFVNTTTTLRHVGIDYAGNEGLPETQTYTIDMVGPVVTKISPLTSPPATNISAAGGGATSSVTLQYQSDTAGTYFIEVGGSATLGTGIQISTGSYPTANVTTSYVLNATSLVEGSNTIYIYVQDAATNVGYNSFNIVRDSEVHTPIIITPEYDYYQTALPITISWSDQTPDATEVSGFGRYELEVSSSAAFGTTAYTNNALATNSQSIAAGLTSGRYFTRVRFVDAIGNISAWSGVRSFYVGKVSNDINADGYSDVVIGVPQFGASDSGKVYIYSGAAGAVTQPSFTITGNTASSWFGNSVDIIEDVNSDGYADIVIGAPKFTGSNYQAGRVYFFYGGTSLTAKCVSYSGSTCLLQDTNADLVIDGQAAGDQFGASVKDIGDINHDGLGDFIVGATGQDTSTGGADSGKYYIWLGKASLTTTPDITQEGTLSLGQYGYSFGRGGDINSDGHADFLTSLPYGDITVSSVAYYLTGAAKINLGGASSVTLGQQLAIGGNSALFGLNIAGGRDLNSDGYSDFLIGAPQSDAWASAGGESVLYMGGGSGSTLVYPVVTFSGTGTRLSHGSTTNAYYGWSQALVGDLDGNGTHEWIICGYSALNSGFTQAGRCYLYTWSGGTSVVSGNFGGSAANENFGNAAKSIGDFNGDGKPDFAVSVYNRTVAANASAGQVGIYYGNSPLPAYTSPDFLWSGESASDRFGYAVSGD